MTAKTKQQEHQLDANLVAEYLANNPDFFQDRDALLVELNLPHAPGGAISLVERQVAAMRERNKESKKKLDEYVKVAKQNDDIYKKCQYMILGLVEADSQEAFLKNLEKGFKRDFKSSAYSLIVFGSKPSQVNHFTTIVQKESAKEYVGSLMKSKKPTLGVLRPSEQDFLFRHQSDKVKSAVVMSVRLGRDQIALLAIGSSDAKYFQAGMGTAFVGFIADTLARLIPRFIPTQ